MSMCIHHKNWNQKLEKKSRKMANFKLSFPFLQQLYMLKGKRVYLIVDLWFDSGINRYRPY
jgi:hypothetical protein